MGIALNVFTVPLFVAAVISAGLLLLTLPQRGKTGAWPMIGLLSASVVWTGSYGMMLGTAEPTSRLFWHNLRFVGPTVAPLAIFVFALEYTGRTRRMTLRNVAYLSVIPILTNVLVWTNGSHHLIRATTTVVGPPGAIVRFAFDWGPWYFLHALYAYVLAMGAMILFVEKYLRLGESATAVKQTRTMFMATLAPLVGSAVYQAGLTQIDFAPFGFAVSAILIIAAITFY